MFNRSARVCGLACANMSAHLYFSVFIGLITEQGPTFQSTININPRLTLNINYSANPG